MKLFIKILIITIWCYLFSSSFGFSQSYNMSILNLNKNFINPAYHGYLSSEITINSTQRNQWLNAPNSYSNNLISINSGCSSTNLGMGLSLYSDNLGEGLMSYNNLEFNIGKEITLGRVRKPNRKTNLWSFSAGLGISVGRRKIKYNRLVFSDQLDPVYGAIFATNALPPFERTNLIVDTKVGLLLRRYQQKSRGKYNINTFGFAVHHLNNPPESFIGFNNFISRRYIGSYSATFNAGNSIINLVTIAQSQNSFRSFTQGVHFGPPNSGFLIGVNFRSANFLYENSQVNIESIILVGEYSTHRLDLAIAYDLNSASLNYTQTSGTLEFSIKYVLSQNRSICVGNTSQKQKRMKDKDFEIKECRHDFEYSPITVKNPVTKKSIKASYSARKKFL